MIKLVGPVEINKKRSAHLDKGIVLFDFIDEVLINGGDFETFVKPLVLDMRYDYFMGKSVGDLFNDFMHQATIAAAPGRAESVFSDIPSYEVAGALRIAANDVYLNTGCQLF